MYNTLSTQLLAIWETGQTQSSVERAMTILAATMQTTHQTNLAALTIGERNIHLLNIHEQVFGRQIHCVTKCEECSEAMEFTLDSHTLKTEPSILPTEFSCTLNDKKYTFRLITCHDLIMAAQQKTLDEAERILIERCFLDMDNRELAYISDSAIQQLADKLKRHDPNAELLLDLACPVCAHAWQTVFDIAAFLWEEITVRAKQILIEIHCLAQAYGWDETTILALSHARRQYYLNQVTK